MRHDDTVYLPKRVRRASALAGLLFLLLAVPARAQEPTTADELVREIESLAGERPSFSGSAFSWGQTLLKKGEDQRLLFGARALGVAEWRKLHLYGRADASKTQDGGAAEGSVSFSDLQSFSDLELYAALGYELLPGIQVIGVYGLAVPIDAGKPTILEKYPKTLTVGVAKTLDYGTGLGFILVTWGRHDAAGGDHFDKLVGTLQLPIKAGVYLVGDVVVNLGTRGASFSRSGIAYKF